MCMKCVVSEVTVCTCTLQLTTSHLLTGISAHQHGPFCVSDSSATHTPHTHTHPTHTHTHTPHTHTPHTHTPPPHTHTHPPHTHPPHTHIHRYVHVTTPPRH